VFYFIFYYKHIYDIHKELLIIFHQNIILR